MENTSSLDFYTKTNQNSSVLVELALSGLQRLQKNEVVNQEKI